MLSALVLLVLVVSPSPVVVMFGPFVVGMCIALVMPTCLALAGERIQGNAGALFGGLLTLAQIGGMVLPAAIGLVARVHERATWTRIAHWQLRHDCAARAASLAAMASGSRRKPGRIRGHD